MISFVSIEEIRIRGSIRDSDVLKMRRALQDEPLMSIEEADALFALNEACPIKDPAWSGFFTETMTDFVVHQMKPEGYIVAEKALWLIAKLGSAGRLKSHIELELLVSVIETARWSPPSLSAFALSQVRHAIETGSGPLRSGQMVEIGAITQAEINLLRRIVLGFGQEGTVAVTRAEAEALIAINQAIAPEKCPPAWTDFFVNAVGNGVLAALGRAVPSRGRAFADDVWVFSGGSASSIGLPSVGAAATEHSEMFRGFGGTVIAGGAGSIWSSCRPQSAEERAMARLERQRLEIVTNEQIDEPGEIWLATRLGRDGRLDRNEMALLAYLKREACGLPSGLNELAARSVIAA